MSRIDLKDVRPSNIQWPVILGFPALILLIPLVAMQFTDEVDWDLMDFIIAGTLLVSSGFAYAVISKMARSNKGRVTIGISIGVILVVIWINLAV